MVMDSECFDWKIKTKAAAAAVVVAFAISNGIATKYSNDLKLHLKLANDREPNQTVFGNARPLH